MNNVNIYNLLLDKSSKSKKDIHYLKRYIHFIKQCIEHNKELLTDTYVEKHHILPKAIYPEYKKEKLNLWNIAKLTARQHVICHLILSKVFPSMALAIHKMLKYNNLEISTHMYALLRERCSLAQSNRTKNLKWIHKDNERRMVHKNEIEIFLNDGWVAGRGHNNFNKNKVWATNTQTGKLAFFESKNHIPIGWVAGLPKNKKKRHAYNEELDKCIFVLEDEIPDGYILGNNNALGEYYKNKYSDEYKLFKQNPNCDEWIKGSPMKNKIFYYDSKTKKCKRFIEGDQPTGWVKGNISQLGVSRTKGRKWYTNPEKTKSKMFLPEEQPSGWTLGRCK